MSKMNGMTVRQAAEYLGVGEHRVLDFIWEGRIKGTKFGERVWMVDEASVRNLVRKPVGRPRKNG